MANPHLVRSKQLGEVSVIHSTVDFDMQDDVTRRHLHREPVAEADTRRAEGRIYVISPIDEGGCRHAVVSQTRAQLCSDRCQHERRRGWRRGG